MRCRKKLGPSSITELLPKGRSPFAYIPGVAVLIRDIDPWLTSSTVAVVQERDTQVLKHLAKDFNLTYTAFGSEIFTEGGPAAGTLTLTDAFGAALEPAPVTPTDEDSAPWQLLSGTIKAVYNSHRGLDGADNIIVSPGIMTGNTGGCTRSVCRQSEVTLRIWDMTSRYEVLLEPHALHCPV